MYHRLPYVSGGFLPFKFLVLYVCRPRDTMEYIIQPFYKFYSPSLITDQLTLPVAGRTKISVEQLLVRASDREQSKINTILRACYLYGLFG
jgi:hypothetical protein